MYLLLCMHLSCCMLLYIEWDLHKILNWIELSVVSHYYCASIYYLTIRLVVSQYYCTSTPCVTRRSDWLSVNVTAPLLHVLPDDHTGCQSMLLHLYSMCYQTIRLAVSQCYCTSTPCVTRRSDWLSVNAAKSVHYSLDCYSSILVGEKSKQWWKPVHVLLKHQYSC
jgi:hypothetical protein